MAESTSEGSVASMVNSVWDLGVVIFLLKSP